MELVVVFRPPPSEAGAPLGSGRMAVSPLLPPWVGGRGGQSQSHSQDTAWPGDEARGELASFPGHCMAWGRG